MHLLLLDTACIDGVLPDQRTRLAHRKVQLRLPVAGSPSESRRVYLSVRPYETDEDDPWPLVVSWFDDVFEVNEGRYGRL